MADRQEIESKLQATISKGEEKVEELKAKMAELGDDASDEARDALAAAENTLQAGKDKLSELTAASDEQFDSMMESAKETWDDLSAQVEGGWASVTDKVKQFFS
jgi:ElaB/YqjD/DUF883 family membrane-anchored ribosome-binding protein